MSKRKINIVFQNLPRELFKIINCKECKQQFSVLIKRLELAPKKAEYCRICIADFEKAGFRPWFSNAKSRNPRIQAVKLDHNKN